MLLRAGLAGSGRGRVAGEQAGPYKPPLRQVCEMDLCLGLNRERFKPKRSGLRRGARVADWDSLENCCGCKPTVGSDPTLSAIKVK